MNTKRCHQCQKQQSLTLFGPRIGKRHGRCQVCNLCRDSEYKKSENLRIKIELHTQKIGRKFVGYGIRINGKLFATASDFEKAVCKCKQYCEAEGDSTFADLFTSSTYGYRATFKRNK